jgi:hypothetical protein
VRHRCRFNYYPQISFHLIIRFGILGLSQRTIAAEAAESPLMHFDISQSSRKLAAAAGAVDRDRSCSDAARQATFDHIAHV